jgi:restriction endonuclease S subunit
MTLFCILFEPIEKGNFGLTDEAIYKSLQRAGPLVPVYGAYQEHTNPMRFIPEKGQTKKNSPITVFDGEGVIINFDGRSAGCMTYKCGERFALNHHAGFAKLKEGAEKMIVPEYFAVFYQKQLQNSTVSPDQKTLSIDVLYSTDFDLPSVDIQKEIISEIKPLLSAKGKIGTLLERINSLRLRVLSAEYKNYQAQDVPISKVLDCMGGNSGLTEQEIYRMIHSDGERFVILSGSTSEDTRLGEAPMGYVRGRKLEVFSDKDGLLVVRKGKAGIVSFIPKGKYTLTDDAYILYLKDDCPYNVSLKWLMAQYRHEFLSYASSSANGTWNKGGFFDGVKIDIPLLAEQEEIVKKYDQLEKLERKLRETAAKIEHLTERQPATVATKSMASAPS